MKVLLNIAFVLLVVWLAGCVGSPDSTYPNFSDYKLKMAAGALLADCVIIDGMIGDTNRIDLVSNKSMGGMLLTYFTDGLVGKGYRVNNTLLTSVGLAMDQHHVYKLAQSVQSEDANLADLPVGVPPFYLNEEFQDASSAVELKRAYDVLLKSTPEKAGPKIVIPGTSDLGKRAEASTLMIILAGGFNVSTSKEFTEESASTEMTIGRVGMQHISQVTIAFYIVDASTGELIWSDQRSSQGGTVHKEKILRLADKIIAALP